MPRTVRRWVIRTTLTLLTLVLVIGPWPTRLPAPGSYTQERWFRDTKARLDSIALAQDQGIFRAGAAQVDLGGLVPVCLAGHPGQMGQPALSPAGACSARALSVAQGNRVVTIVGADLLLINDALAQAVAERSGVERTDLFFTATHTHTGPGGWGAHPLERLVAGTYDPDQANHLADRIAQAVAQSRRHLDPAEVAFVAVPCPGRQINRIDPSQPTNEALAAWIVRTHRPDGSARVLATLATFGAHATITGGQPPRLDGDYPARFASQLAERVETGIVLFAAGTVGDSAPVRPAGLGPRAAAVRYGELLADSLASAMPTARFEDQIHLTSLSLAVALPPVWLPMGSASLRFSPLATWWISPRRTRLHFLRFGPACLVGFPGDIAGQLTSRLQASVPVVATSFNGDYKGYLVARETFRRRPCYETRWMSFFGPDLGEALVDLAQRGLDRIMAGRD